MKAVIVEDELAFQEQLSSVLCKTFPGLEIASVADNVPDAIEAISNHQPDILYLDVEIKSGTGFDVLSQLAHRPFDIIFTSAYSTFALEAFRYHAIDYLLKPLSAFQIIEATERCIKRSSKKDQDNISLNRLIELLKPPRIQKSKLGIHTLDGIEFVDISDIMYGEAKGNYAVLWMKNDTKITTARKLKEIEEYLPKQQFFRIHHSYIVNIQFAKKYYKGRGGYIVLHNGKSLPVSAAKKDDFFDWLG
jgi:two-component system LytT family response regulator